jgi:outer membrane protein assembly factor BamB
MIPGAVEGGYGSVTVAGDRCYLYVNWKTHDSITTRKLSTEALRRLGWNPLKIPQDLAKATEEARTSPERAQLKPGEVGPWVKKWTAEHVTGDRESELLPVVAERLTRGPAAIPLDVLDKLAGIKDREFESQAALDKWFRDSGVEDEVQAAVLKEVPTTATRATDTIVSLNRADGSLVWKKQYPGLMKPYGTSSTPCVSGGRLYVAGAETIYCLKADDGSEVWKVRADGNEGSSASPVLVDGNAMRAWGLSSSPTVVDGVVAILAWELVGLDCRDGKRLWSQPKLRGSNASPVVWRKDGKAYLLCNTGTDTAACVEPATGKILWEVPGGGGGTVALGEDAFVIYSERNQTGVVAYSLSVEKPRRLWARPSTGLERGTTPVIQGGYVYVVGGNRVLCLNMADGSTAWEQKYKCEMSSPVLASGKIFAMVEMGNQVLMIKASGEKFELLGDARIQTVRLSSPAVADGRLYLRLHDGVACYDLRK